MDYTATRIEQIARNEGISVGELERSIGASKGVISRAIKNGTDIQAKWLQLTVENYPAYSTDWLLTGKGSMLREEDLDEVGGTYLANQEEYDKAKELGLNLIPEYSDAFKGGYRGTMISTDEISAYWAIPNVKADMVIEVEGDSMAKAYPAGSRVAVREIQFDRQYPTVGIPFGEVFGIIVDNGDENYLSYIKRLRRHPDKALQYKYWIAQSDNEAYDDFEIEISKVRHLFIVVAGVKLTRF